MMRHAITPKIVGRFDSAPALAGLELYDVVITCIESAYLIRLSLEAKRQPSGWMRRDLQRMTSAPGKT